MGDSKKLGEWAGLCKIDKEGKPRKVNGCGVVVVKVCCCCRLVVKCVCLLSMLLC